MPCLEFRRVLDRKSTRLKSSHTLISYAVFCLKKNTIRSEEHTSELQSHSHLVFRLLLDNKRCHPLLRRGLSLWSSVRCLPLLVSLRLFAEGVCFGLLFDAFPVSFRSLNVFFFY